MEFEVSIENFDGPLDLMLHLIKEKQLDIFHLDIAVLADQYIAYIHRMEELHLDIASEYLAELAGLIEFKSKKLLPIQQPELEDNYQEQQETDLVQRLVEYQKYKEVSSQFAELYKERNLLHDKPQSEIANEWINENGTYDATSPYELIKAMKRVLARYTIANPYEVSITNPKTTVEDRTKQLIKKYRSYDKVFTLGNVLEDCQNKYDVVVSFLAILTMVNDNYLVFSIQNDEVYFQKGVSYEQ